MPSHPVEQLSGPIGEQVPGSVAANLVRPPEAFAEKPGNQRILSLDAFRGLIMILLVSDGLGFRALSRHPLYHGIATQFIHSDWVGTDFYDVIAPAFVFMVGMAMPYALGRRVERGATFWNNLGHVTVRALRLLLLSQILISIEANKLHFQMHNILSQIAVGYFVCFLIMQLKFSYQVLCCAALLTLHSVLFVLLPGLDGPFTKMGNIGAVFDRALMGYNYASWTTNFNMVSYTASMLFGVWTGYLLRSARARAVQLRILAASMVAAFAAGIALATFIPMIRRIWTASFALYSLGWVLLMFLVLYLLIDFFGFRKMTFPLIVAGSNAIFLYSVGEILRGWLDKSVAVFTGGFEFLGTFAPVAQSCTVLLVMWLMCYWLYRHKIFLRL